jgi:hypothetical protein
VIIHRYRLSAHNQSLRDRSSLLGEYSTPPASGRSSPEPSSIYGGGQRYADDLEDQNDERLDGLTAKVKLLKNVRVLVFFFFAVAVLAVWFFLTRVVVIFLVIFFFAVWGYVFLCSLGLRSPSRSVKKFGIQRSSSVRWYVGIQVLVSIKS